MMMMMMMMMMMVMVMSDERRDVPQLFLSFRSPPALKSVKLRPQTEIHVVYTFGCPAILTFMMLYNVIKCLVNIEKTPFIPLRKT